MPVCYKWQEHLIPYRAVAKSNNFMGKRYVEVFESKAGEMEWTCKRMGQPQDRGNESVVRLRGLPFQVSKEEIAQFFTGKETHWFLNFIGFSLPQTQAQNFVQQLKMISVLILWELLELVQLWPTINFSIVNDYFVAVVNVRSVIVVWKPLSPFVKNL